MFKKRREKYLGAIVQLNDYIDRVLEAFQTGTGIRNGTAEPITLDIARRMIWGEVSRVVTALLERQESESALELRISGASTLEILVALNGNWQIRVLGPRREGDTSVVYASIAPVNSVAEARKIVSDLKAAGLEVRDLSLGHRL